MLKWKNEMRFFAASVNAVLLRDYVGVLLDVDSNIRLLKALGSSLSGSSDHHYTLPGVHYLTLPVDKCVTVLPLL